MNTVQHWGRKESLIWPPRGFCYTHGALFLAIVFTSFLVYLRIQVGMKALQRYYLPYYIRSGYSFRPTAKFQLLYVTDGKRSRLALLGDVEQGQKDQFNGKPLPLTLTDSARKEGYRWLLREPERAYQTKLLHAFFQQQIFAGDGPWLLFSAQVYFGLLAFAIQLPLTIPKDIKRRKELRYGRRLKGPYLVSAKEFNQAVKGDGIGIKTKDIDELLCIPSSAENKHILAIGDTGSGKTSIIRQLAFRIEEREESAVIYDPAGEFIRQYYSEKRKDIVLNPLDERMPYWNPAEEVDDEPEALALAESFYQPDDIPNKFFVESPQKIFAYLISQRNPMPRPEDLIQWMASKNEIEDKLAHTELAILVDRIAGPQRVGVLSSLNKIATTLRLLPTVADGTARKWSAKEWSEKRDGWIFLTSTPKTRQAIRPLHCVWLDMLVMHLISARKTDEKRVWFLIDELASLQKLPQLHTALTENRKSENPVVLGFQGRSQLETRYGHDAEAMLSQPATKIFLRTDEPHAAKWISDNIGEVEIERLKETHDGSRSGKNFMLERLKEPLVMPSEIQGLADLSVFLKYGNYVARFSVPFIELEDKHPDFIRRKRKVAAAPQSLATRVDEPPPTDPDEKSVDNELGMQV